MFAHPTPSRLLRWLDDNPSKLEKYLGKHPEAEPELEQLSPLPAPASRALANALAAPIDLAERLRARMAIQESPTDPAAVARDLIGLGWRTATLLFGEEPPGELGRAMDRP